MRKIVNGRLARFAVIAVGAAFLAALMVGSGLGASHKAAAPDVIKGAFFRGSFPNLPEAVALDQGFFKKHNIDYQPIEIAGGGAQQGAALAGGSIDFAPQEVRAIIVADAHGGSFQQVCGSFRAPIYDLVMKSSWQIRNKNEDWKAVLEDIKGAKIGISSLGSGTDFNISLLLKNAGLPDNWVTRVPIGGDPVVALAAFKAGQIDGSMSFEPATQLLLANGGKNVLALSHGAGPPVLQRYVTNGYTALASNVTKKHDAYKRFCQAIADAVTFIENPLNANAVVSAFRGQTNGGGAIPDDIVKKAIANYHATYNPIITPARYSLQVKMLYQFGFLQQSEKAPPFWQVVSQTTQPIGYFVERFTANLAGKAKGNALLTVQGRKICWNVTLSGGGKASAVTLNSGAKTALKLGNAKKGCTTGSARLAATIDDLPGSFTVQAKTTKGMAVGKLAL